MASLHDCCTSLIRRFRRRPDTSARDLQVTVRGAAASLPPLDSALRPAVPVGECGTASPAVVTAT